MTKQFEEIGKKIAAGEAGQYEAAILWQELERVNTGEPPQPRCPKCKSENLRLIVEATSLVMSIYCINGHDFFNLQWPKGFAQFFGPSAPQPARPPKQRDADLIVPPKPPRLADAVKFSHTAESLGSELWDQWFCRAMTSKETWMKHVMPILDKYFPCAPQSQPQQGDVATLEDLSRGIVCFPCQTENICRAFKRCKELRDREAIASSPSGSAGQEPEGCTCKKPDFQHAICPVHDTEAAAMMGLEPEGRAESAAETVDTVGHTKAVVRPVVSASPTTQEIGDIVTQIIGAWPIEVIAPSRPTITRIVKLARPFFTQVSQELNRDDLLDLKRIMELLREHNITDTDVLKHTLEDHDRWHADIIAGRLIEPLAAPVTPVSANGTEPQLNRDDLLDLKRIMELLREHDISDTDVLKHTLEDHDRWRAEMLAGAASHNGQGWEAKLRNLIAAKEPNGYPLWFNRAVRACKDCDSEDCCDRHHAIAARDFTGCDEFISQFMAALPAPPSEADGPQEEE